MDDMTLIDRLFARDRKAVLQFYRQYAPPLRRHILSKVSAPDDAEELLQDTLYAFLEGLRDFQGKSSIKTYIYSICQHKIIDYYRRKKMKHLVFSQMPQLEMLVSPLLGPEAQFDSATVREQIKSVFAHLQPTHREILTLKYLEDVPVEEIARKLAITFKSAESRLFRARKNFVEAFLSV